MLGVLILLALLATTCRAQPTFSDNCVVFNETTGTCFQCMPGYYMQYFFCVVCNPLCHCSSRSNFCEGCLSLAYKQTNLSLASYYDPQQNRCYLCSDSIANCLTCNSPSNCSQCLNGFYVVNITNGNNQVVGAACSLTPCQPTSLNTTNCEICTNQNTCFLCRSGYFIVNSICAGVCPINCQLCSASTTCKLCKLGYFTPTANPTCTACLPQCEVCTNTTVCISCIAGFGFDPVQGACLNTTISNCILYSGGYSTCNVCQPGYFVLGGSCNQCVGCQLCAIQFVCWTQCQAPALPFNYACNTYEQVIRVAMGLLVLILVIFD